MIFKSTQYSATWQPPIRLVCPSGTYFVPDCLPDLAVGGFCTCASVTQNTGCNANTAAFPSTLGKTLFLQLFKKKKKKQERFTDICKTESKLEYHKVFYCQSQTFFSLSRIKLIIIMECSKKKKKSQCQSSCYNILKTWWKLSVPEIKASSPVPLMASNDLGKPYSHIVSVDLVTRCGRCSHSEWWTLLSSFHGQRS